MASKFGSYKVKVTSGDMLFSPIRYNTFNVGSVEVEASFEGDVDPKDAIAEVSKVVRDEFAERYKQRLEFYLQAIKYNDRRVKSSREPSDG